MSGDTKECDIPVTRIEIFILNREDGNSRVGGWREISRSEPILVNPINRKICKYHQKWLIALKA